MSEDFSERGMSNSFVLIEETSTLNNPAMRGYPDNHNVDNPSSSVRAAHCYSVEQIIRWVGVAPTSAIRPSITVIITAGILPPGLLTKLANLSLVGYSRRHISTGGPVVIPTVY